MSMLATAMILSAAGTATTAGLQFAAAKEQDGDIPSDQIFFGLPRGIETFPLAEILGSDIASTFGRSDSGIARQADPFTQALSEIQQNPGLSEKQKRRASVGLNFLRQTGQEHNDPKPRNAARLALTRTSFSNPGGLLQAAAEFEQERQRLAEARDLGGGRTLEDVVLGGRIANEISLAELLSDFPSATASDLQSLEAEARGVIDERFDEQIQDVLERANAQGINPAAILGELEQARETETRTAPLERALALLGGRQALAGQELTARLAGRAQPQDAATALLALQGQSAATAGQVAAQQALARSQASQQERLAGLGLQNQAIGTIGQGFGDLATIALLPSLTKGPATDTQGVEDQLANLFISNPDLF